MPMGLQERAEMQAIAKRVEELERLVAELQKAKTLSLRNKNAAPPVE